MGEQSARWIEKIDKKERPYWIDPATGVSTWDAPPKGTVLQSKVPAIQGEQLARDTKVSTLTSQKNREYGEGEILFLDGLKSLNDEKATVDRRDLSDPDRLGSRIFINGDGSPPQKRVRFSPGDIARCGEDTGTVQDPEQPRVMKQAVPQPGSQVPTTAAEGAKETSPKPRVHSSDEDSSSDDDSTSTGGRSSA